MEKRRRRELDLGEFLELMIGPRGSGQSAFPSDEARREAWEDHREELEAEDPPGKRCWAARRYDEPVEEDPDPNEDAPPWGRG